MGKREHLFSLYEAFKGFVRSNDSIDRGSKVLAAVSGGVDSIVMLDLLARLSSEWNLELTILHVNHQLRGSESAGDEKFVRGLAKRYKVRMFAARVQTKAEAARKKVSIQEAARHLRYAFFEAKRLELKADFVATAHNANDNSETMLLNLFRERELTASPEYRSNAGTQHLFALSFLQLGRKLPCTRKNEN